MIWQRMANLEEQQVELQAEQENLENRSRCNNIRIRGIPKGAEGEHIMAFATERLQTIGGNGGDPPLIHDRAHRVSLPR